MIFGMLNEIRCAVGKSKKLTERVADFHPKIKVYFEEVLTYFKNEGTQVT